MTGAQILAEFEALVTNDLYPVFATTDAAKLETINIAARRVMSGVKILYRQSPLTYTTGTTRYSLLALPVPIISVNRVRMDDVDYYESVHEQDLGWTQIGEYIDIFFAADNAATIEIDGYKAGAPIVDTSAAITDIPVDLHMAIVQLAIVEACVADEDDQGQLLRLQRLEQSANAKVSRYEARMNSNRFPFKSSRT